MKAAVLLKWYRTGLMKIETPLEVIEHRSSMIPWGLMDILPGNPIYVYIEDFMESRLVCLGLQ